MRFINREFSRFIFWGGVNTLCGYLVYALLLLFLQYLVAYTITYALGILVSYYLNSRFVFRREVGWRKAVQYPLVYLVQYLLGTGSLYLLVRVLRVNKLLAPVIVILLTVPLTYLMGRRIIRGRRDGQPKAQA
jgi:putative flippase GtrA